MENQTIIVKKVKKGGHGHHGGAWKVAFADFATAMMAFFLLLWLIASTTKEERAGISEYFSPPTQGIADGSGMKEDVIDMGGGQKISQGDESKEDARKPTAQQIREAIEAEKIRLESLMEELKKLIEESQALKPFKDQLLLDITPEGLRIQIVDKENRPMFDSGSAELKGYTKEILHELAKTINTVPNRISLTGHTDAALFVGRENYSNWELSADRANSSRRELIIGGLASEKMAKVVGLASMVAFDKEHPRSPINRRIAIIVMNKAAEAALFNETNQVSSAAEGEQLITDGPVETKKSIVGSIPMNKTLLLKAAEKTPVTQTAAATPEPVVKAEPKPVVPVKPEPVVKVEAKPVIPVKPQPVVKPKPKPLKKTKPSPKKAADDAGIPPAQKDEQQFINIPSPISPINPIKLPGAN
jgi:chemotaxis protein MotB